MSQVPTSPQQANSAPEDLVGQVLGDLYDVTSELQSTAGGTLYLARHAQDGQELLVRTFHVGGAWDDTANRTFQREERALLDLRHGSILAVLDSGTTDGGTRYLVMERPAHRTLREVIKREHRLPTERALSILMQVARALAVARGAGVMHGNLTPECVLLMVQAPGKNDVIKLAELGEARLARLLPSGTGHHVVGTLRSMAPEQMAGMLDDPRSDIFALGLLLFEMLTGKPAYNPEHEADLLRMHAAPPPSLQSAFPDVRASKMLQDLLPRLLAVKPDARPSHAMLLEEIEILPEYLEPETGEAGAPSLGLALPGASHTPSLGVSFRGNNSILPGGPSLAFRDEQPTMERAVGRQARKAGIPTGVFVGLGAVVLLGAGAVWVVAGKPAAPPPVEVPAQPVEAPGNEVDVDLDGMKLTAGKKRPPPKTPGTKPAAAAAAPESAASHLTRITVTSDPPGALVLDGPIARGTTPTVLVLPRSDASRALRFTLEGHVEASRSVKADADSALHVVLAPAAGGGATAPVEPAAAAPVTPQATPAPVEAPPPAEPVVDTKAAPIPAEKPTAPIPAPAEKTADPPAPASPAPAVDPSVQPATP